MMEEKSGYRVDMANKEIQKHQNGDKHVAQGGVAKIVSILGALLAIISNPKNQIVQMSSEMKAMIVKNAMLQEMVDELKDKNKKCQMSLLLGSSCERQLDF